MSVSLNEIKGPISRELDLFEVRFRESMKSKVSLLDSIMTYIVKRKGKQMRPMFVLYAAKICGGITEETYRGAALVELLHTATLVHDDVVDDAQKRRGFFSINALWKNKIAVLVGDYLLSKGLLLSINNNDYGLLKILSEAVKQMSEGELLQIEKARKLDISEDVYFDIITKKTASLIASCCAIGAATGSGNEEAIEKMRVFGEKIGIAFQIKDDLFDYGKTDIGKPTGIDIKEKKMTLPLIYALNAAPSSERKKIINLVKNNNKDKGRIQEVISFVERSGGIEYTRKMMVQYHQEALAALAGFPDSDSKTKITQLVDYVISREK